MSELYGCTSAVSAAAATLKGSPPSAQPSCSASAPRASRLSLPLPPLAGKQANLRHQEAVSLAAELTGSRTTSRAGA